MNRPLFTPGRTVITARAHDALHAPDVARALTRHICGDWGELDEHDRHVNEQGLRRGGRLLSAYRDSRGVRFWIITEHDRSVTTVLLPEDY